MPTRANLLRTNKFPGKQERLNGSASSGLTMQVSPLRIIFEKRLFRLTNCARGTQLSKSCFFRSRFNTGGTLSLVCGFEFLHGRRHKWRFSFHLNTPMLHRLRGLFPGSRIVHRSCLFAPIDRQCGFLRRSDGWKWMGPDRYGLGDF